MMKNAIVLLFLINLCLINNLSAHESNNLDIDFDLDGKPDKVTITIPRNSSDDYVNESVPVTIRVDFSSGKRSFEGVLPVESGIVYSMMPYARKEGYLVLDFTNRSTRDATLIIAQLYRWDADVSKLCLYAEVTGVSGNTLKKEFYPSFKQVAIFNECKSLADSSPHEEDEDNGYWKKNTNISVKITEKKAALYDSANFSTKTKMYLIKDDKVIIKNYMFSQKDGTDWFLIEYFNEAKNLLITKWIEGKSIGLVLPN
ncbi:MAG: hypothetical protein FWD67_07320 [Betaproteobacteria bacterium]|nr:hypothetical protein [Betaproteobacteria bacterium]